MLAWGAAALGVIVPSPAPSTTDAAIAARKSELRACYGKRPVPRKNGVVRVWYEYDAAGAVTSAKVAESTLKAPTVEACLLSVVRSTKFPASNGKHAATYSFHFSSQ